MTYRIGKTFTFSAGHHLPDLPAGHKCARPHGHNYTIEVTLCREELVPPGFVTDFGDLAPVQAYLEAYLDHRDLNEVLGFPPTSERLARHVAEWFIEHVEPHIPGRLERVRVSETPTSWAEYVVEER